MFFNYKQKKNTWEKKKNENEEEETETTSDQEEDASDDEEEDASDDDERSGDEENASRHSDDTDSEARTRQRASSRICVDAEKILAHLTHLSDVTYTCNICKVSVYNYWLNITMTAKKKII